MKENAKTLIVEKGQVVRLKAEPNGLYQVNSGDLAENVIVQKVGDNLVLIYADGSSIIIEEFYSANAEIVIAQDGDQPVVITAEASGEVLADGSELIIAHGDSSVLLQMVEGNEALTAALTTAESSGYEFGWGTVLIGLGLIGAGVAVAGGSGSGGGGSSSNDNTVQLDTIEETEDIPSTLTTEATNVVINIQGTENEDTLTLDAPNAETITITGDLSSSSDELVLAFDEGTAGEKDTHTMTIVTDVSGDNNKLVFDFADANDVVVLNGDSQLGGFESLEVHNGTLDLTGIQLPDGTYDIEVNSTLVVTLNQFLHTTSLISVTGHGDIQVKLADGESIDTLVSYLEDAAANESFMLIGGEVTVFDSSGNEISSTALTSALDAVYYPSIPEIEVLIEDLQSQIDNLEIADIDNLAATLTTLGLTSTALETTVNDALENYDSRLAAIESQLSSITDTVVAYVDSAVADLQAQIDALDETGADDIATLVTDISNLNNEMTTLSSSINALEVLVGETSVATQIGDAVSALQVLLSEADTALGVRIDTLTSQLESDVNNLQAQIDVLDETGADDIATLVTDISNLNNEMTTLSSSINALEVLVGETSVATQIGDAVSALQVLLSEADTALGVRIDTLTSQLESDVNNLQAQIDVLDETGADDIATLVTDISNLNNEMTTLSSSINALEVLVGETSVATQIGDAVSALQVLLSEADTALGVRIDTLTSQLESDVNNLQDQIDVLDIADISGLSTQLTSLNNAISGLQALTGTDGEIDLRLAAVEAQLSGVVDTVVAYIETYVGTPESDTGSGDATGLFADIIDLQNQIDSSDVELAVLMDDSAANDGTATTNSIAGLVAALSALESTVDTLGGGSAADISTLQDSVGVLQSLIGEPESSEGADDATGLYADIADLQSQIDGIVAPSLITANELDNHIELYDYSGDSDFIRVEAGAGDDTINSFAGDTEIVGGLGADSINLTSADSSSDSVIYQTVFDGQHLPVTTVSFSNDTADYRTGTVLTVTVNGIEVSHTVTSDESGNIEASLSGLAADIESVLIPVDVSAAIVGTAYAISDPTVPLNISVADLDADGSYTVPDGYYFISATDSLIADTYGEAATDYKLTSGETFTVTDESYYAIDESVFAYDSSAFKTYEIILHDRNDVEADMYLEETGVNQNSSLSLAVANGSTLTLTGLNSDTVLIVDAGGDIEAAITNSGTATVYSVEFSSAVEDWPTATDDDNSTEFDRELSVILDLTPADSEDANTTISAAVQYNEDGTPDMTGSVAALVSAINSYATDNNVSITATVNEENGYLIDIAANTAAQSALDLPTFTVESAQIDSNGAQQEVTVSFSTDDADYYEGGTLSVDINGKTVTAAMVAGDAVASVLALEQAVEAARVEVVSLGSSSIVELTLWENAALTDSLNTENAGSYRYYLNFRVDDTTYSFSAYYDSDGPATLGAFVTYMNEQTADDLTWEFDAETNVLRATSVNPGASITSLDYFDVINTNDSSVYARTWNVTAGDPVDDTLVNPELAILESAEQDDPTVLSTSRFYDSDSGNDGFQSFKLDGYDPATAISIYQHFVVYLYDESYGDYVCFKVNQTGGDLYSNVQFDSFEDFVTTLSSKAYVGQDADAAEIPIEDVSVRPIVEYDTATDVITFSSAEGVYYWPLSSLLAKYYPSGTDITLTASSESDTDPLTVSAEMDYAGELQTAIIELDDLNDGNSYGSLTDGTITDHGAAVYYDGGQVYAAIESADGLTRVTVSAAMVADDAAATSQALTDAINAAITNGTDSIDTLISAASYNSASGEITLTAAQAGTETFHVDEVTLDYQGVQQLATATYSTNSDDYYENGTMSITIDIGDAYDDLETIDVDESLVTVTATMVDGDATASIQALVDAVQTEITSGDLTGIIGNVAVDNGTITLTSTDYSEDVFTIANTEISYAGVAQQSEVTFSANSSDYYEGGQLSVTIAGETISVAMTPPSNYLQQDLELNFSYITDYGSNGDYAFTLVVGDTTYTRADFDTYLTSIGREILDDSMASGHVTIEDLANWVNTLEGVSATAETESDCYIRLTPDSGITVEFDVTGGSYLNTGRTTWYDATYFEVQTYTIDPVSTSIEALADAIIAATESGGVLEGVIGDVVSDGSTITLTAADVGADSFSVSQATESVEAVTQVSEIDFGSTSDDTFYATDDEGNPGTISVTIAGVTVTADMADSKADTIQNLADQIIALRDGDSDAEIAQDAAIAAAVGEVSISGDVIVLTAVSTGVDPMNVSSVSYSTPYTYGEEQEMTLYFSNTVLESAEVVGETISVTINDITTDFLITQELIDGLNGADQSETIIAELLQAVIDDHSADDVISSLDTAAAVTAQSGNTLTFIADTSGIGLLNPMTASLTQNDGSEVNPTAIILEEVSAGTEDISEDTSSAGITINDDTGEGNAETGADEYILSAGDSDSDDLAVTNNSVAGEAADPIEQMVTNPTTENGLSGDAALTGVDEESGDLLGIDQSWENPSDGYDADNGETIGTAELAGADSGYYADDGLYTSDDVYVDSTDKIDSIITAGEAEGELTAADSILDSFTVTQDELGIESYTWDDAVITSVYNGSSEADLITNFQTGIDKISIEGDLATALGSAEGVDSVLLPGLLDLSSNGFGLISSIDNNSVTSSELDNAEAIADLFNDMFDFDADGEATTDNGEFNATIFAVTASDDSSQTAIWVHDQSSTGDSTVDSGELSLLALVDTLDGEFSVTDFVIDDSPV